MYGVDCVYGTVDDAARSADGVVHRDLKHARYRSAERNHAILICQSKSGNRSTENLLEDTDGLLLPRERRNPSATSLCGSLLLSLSAGVLRTR